MFTILDTSTCDICEHGFTDGGPHTASVIPCGHVMCHACLTALTPSRCPLCRAAFSPESIQKLHCDIRSDFTVVAQPDVTPGLRSSAPGLKEQITSLLNASTGEDHLRRCQRLQTALDGFLQACNADESNLLRPYARALAVHINGLEGAILEQSRPLIVREQSALDQPATCDVCNHRITGVRWRCQDCPDWDSCSACYSTSVPTAHPEHRFVKIESRQHIPAPKRSFRHRARCDACDKEIWDIRYKCTHPNCPNFDLCAACEALPKPVHPISHPLLKLRTLDTSPPAPNTAPVPVPGSSSRVDHHAWCNLCRAAILDVRWKCLECPDWDACEACYNQLVPTRHPTHRFVRVDDPHAISPHRTNTRVQHMRIKCDHCQGNVYDVRFKCMHCPDYDLCAKCEALPIKVHPTNHPLLKISDPATALPFIPRGRT
ncbi:hypothetical protein EXIGLDRAFT_731333 [Exidia glandulosa HHB12029]|uniref:RING-type domain-containing protein n=1 Tax=Exidia glandulosa HHB12029 TaxID=1314781 RepID=A0A165BXQ9_EXIGL|nr:hypothetical protein EXIGLDRAFT_731333 [Exidia glandulosa HHB12029]